MPIPVSLAPDLLPAEQRCNPGNIRCTTPRTLWQGRVASTDMTDTVYESFVAPKWGIRAIAVSLISAHDKHGCTTVHLLLDYWAEALTDRYIYAGYVAEAAGLSLTALVDVQDYETMRNLVAAIIRRELGHQPYADAVLEEGLKLAGVIKDADKLPGIAATPTGKAAIGTAAAGAAAVTLPQITAAVSGLAPVLAELHAASPWIGLALIAATLTGFLYWRYTTRQVLGT